MLVETNSFPVTRTEIGDEDYSFVIYHWETEHGVYWEAYLVRTQYRDAGDCENGPEMESQTWPEHVSSGMGSPPDFDWLVHICKVKPE